MDWGDVVPIALENSARIADRCERLRDAAHSFVVEKQASYYWDPATDLVSVNALPNADWEALFKSAASFGPVCEKPLFLDDPVLLPRLVKVGYSQALHTLGEWGNFFPGHYPGGIPNHPSPLASMLTSGLVGAGLGWGTGKLIEKVLPRGYGRNLGRTGAILGGLVGGAPGVMWGASNLAMGKSLNDPSLLQGNVEPSVNPSLLDGTAPPPTAPSPFGNYLQDVMPFFNRRQHKDAADALAFVQLAEHCQSSIDAFVKQAFGDTFGSAPAHQQATPLDVNIGALGQTLWDVAAPPPLTAATMGAMYAASQLPDPRARPGWATMNQLGQLAERSGNPFQQGALVGLATNAVSDYLTGTLGGVALNSLVGTPYAARTFGAVNAGLGMLGRVIGSLWS